MLLLLAACSGEPELPEIAVGPTGTVTILSGRDEQFALRLLDLVHDELPNLTVVTDFGKDSGYLDRITAWNGQPKADLFLSKSSGAMSSLSTAGYAARLPDELLQAVPERLRGPEGDWVGLSVRARVLVTRADVEDPPTSVMELADPRWKGRVARTVATNGSFVGGVATLVAEHGEEDARTFLTALAANTEGNVHPKHTPAVAAVADGSADVALVNHYYFYRNVLGQEADASADAAALEAVLAAHDLRIIYPDAEGVGTAWNVTGGAVLQGSPNAPAAEAVLGVLLSPEGQQAYAHTNREYPAVEGTPAPPGVTAASDFAWSKTSLAALAEAEPTAVKLIQEVGLE
ncbi:MAG: extracellular solute-binding protein [Proteobacteria bacterium]|nr:extracellular solute-binding protein [Pseudomonadota bacterium]MCP4919884.1 extracellular solute-binding protein [Pseudomonadota bacterium]